MEHVIDLHLHSTASDGSDAPEVLVQHAAENGLSAVALTDHDTVSGLPEFLHAAEKAGIEAVPGVELSSMLKGKEIHVVGLFIDPEAETWSDFLAAQRADRDRRNREMVEKLRASGYDITMEEVMEEAGDGSAGRPHIGRVLLRKGYFPDMKEAFAKCLKRGMPCYVSRQHMHPVEAIRRIHEAGGLAVWAHPVLAADTRSAMRRVLRELVPAGLDAMETRYSMYTPDKQEAAESIAREFRLLESGGSDYHGTNQPLIRLGTGLGSLCVPYSFLEKMRAKRDQKELS